MSSRGDEFGPADLQLLIDSIPALIHSSLPDGYLDYFNQRWLEYVGVPLEDVQGWKWRASIHPDDVAGIVDKWRACLASGEIFEYEARVRRADGEYRWMVHRKVPQRDGRGKIVKWYGSSIDIEDRKRTEDGLRAVMSERARLSAVRADIAMALARKDNLRGILHSCAEAMVRHLDAAFSRIWTFNSEARELELQASAGRYTRLDGRYSRIPIGEIKIGLIAQERKPHLTNDVQNDPRISNQDWARAEKMTAFAGYPLVVEDRIVGVMAMFSQNPLTEGTLDTLSFLADGIAQGIERKHAEENLRRSEFYLAEGQRLAHMGSWMFNISGFFDYWSRELFNIFGIEAAGRGPTLGEYLALVHPAEREFVAHTIEKMLAERSGCDFKKRIVRPCGEVRYVRCVGVPMVDQGTFKGFVGTAMDITEQEELTQQLRRRQAYLSEAQRLSHTGSFGWSVGSGKINWSDETFRIFEYDEETEPTLELVLQRTHPDDKALIQELIDRACRDGKDFDVEHRLLLPNGSVKNVHVVAHALRDASGNIEFVGAVMDVTQAKQARAALEKAFKEIETLKDQLYKENIALREEIDKASMFEEIVGSSEALRKVLLEVAKVAPTDSTVLILGETGTGKELIARAIHNRSHRSTGAFIRVSCAATPPSLIASELFGHEKGAFTGASQRRLGRFESADGGTIFLDEIGELPMETQIALLRVLQEREFERVGGNQPISVNVRVLAATNRDLRTAVATGTFRQDLFYRLSVFPIRVPPLRDRREDIPLLVQYLIERYGEKAGKKIRKITKDTLDLFQVYDWPGNIRELQNVVERAVILCDGETFSVDETWLQCESRQSTGPTVPLAARLVEHEKEVIESALAECEGRISGPSGAASKLGLPRQTLESKIAKLRIDRYRFKPGRAQSA